MRVRKVLEGRNSLLLKITSTVLYVSVILVSFSQLRVVPPLLTTLIPIMEVAPIAWLLNVIMASYSYFKVIKGNEKWIILLLTLFILSLAIIQMRTNASDNLYLAINNKPLGPMAPHNISLGMLKAFYSPVEDYAILKSYSFTISKLGSCESSLVPPISLKRGEKFEVGSVDLKKLPAGDYKICADVVDYIADVEFNVNGELHLRHDHALVTYRISSVNLNYLWTIEAALLSVTVTGLIITIVGAVGIVKENA